MLYKTENLRVTNSYYHIPNSIRISNTMCMCTHIMIIYAYLILS